MGFRTIVLTLLALCFGLVPSVSRPSQGHAALDDGLDSDGDGIVDSLDVCPTNASGVAVDSEGRPLGDIDKNCSTDLYDFRLMQLGWTGNAEFDAVGLWDAFYDSGGNVTYYGRFTFYASHLLAIDAVVPSYPDTTLYYTVQGNTGTVAQGAYFYRCTPNVCGPCTASGTLFFDGPDSMILTLHGDSCNYTLFLHRR